jgi:predicted DNA-binding protein (UPF0251 family)
MEAQAIPQAMNFVMVPASEWTRIIEALTKVESILNRPKDDKWISAQEASDMLGVSTHTFTRYCKTYNLQVARVNGKNIRVLRSEVENLLKAKSYDTRTGY